MTERGSKISAVLITALIMVILGGAGYYYLDQKYKSDKESLEKQIITLNDQITAINAGKDSAVLDEGTAATTAAESVWLYKNPTYGFSLTFNEKWDGYRMKMADIAGSTATYYVCVPTTDKTWSSSADAYPGTASIFAFSVYTKAEWATAEAEEVNYDTKIGETGTYVIAYSSAQAAPEDIQDSKISSDIKNVVATFKAI